MATIRKVHFSHNLAIGNLQISKFNLSQLPTYELSSATTWQLYHHTRCFYGFCRFQESDICRLRCTQNQWITRWETVTTGLFWINLLWQWSNHSDGGKSISKVKWRKCLYIIVYNVKSTIYKSLTVVYIHVRGYRFVDDPGTSANVKITAEWTSKHDVWLLNRDLSSESFADSIALENWSMFSATLFDRYMHARQR